MANSKRKKTSGYFVTVGTGEKIQYNSNPTRSKPKVTETQKQAAEARVQQYRSAAKENASTQSGLSKPAKITSDVSGEAWTRATPSQVKLPSGYTVAQQSEMNRLQEQRRQAQVDLDTDTVNSVDKRMKEIRKEAGKQTGFERVGSVLSGSGKLYGGQLAGTAGTLVEGAGKLNTRIENYTDREKLQTAEDNITRYQQMLSSGKDLTGKALTAEDRKRIQSYIKHNQAVLDSHKNYTAAVENVDKETADTLYGKSLDLIDSGSKDVEKAKEDLGFVGRAAVDLGVAGTQMAADAALGTFTGTALIPMFIRSFGGGAIEAKQNGATYGQQLAYGALSAGTEVATEKISNVSGVFKKVYGGGVVDEAVKKAVKKLSSNAVGQALLTAGASAGGEGFEEFVSDVFAPIWQRATYAKDPYASDKYGAGNIDLKNRPQYQNADGTISTVDSWSFNIDGKEVLLPSVWMRDGKPYRSSNADEILRHYKETGEYLGKFDTVEQANAYAEKLHQEQNQYYNVYQNAKFDLGEAMYDAMIGAAMGLIGDAGNIVNTTRQASVDNRGVKNAGNAVDVSQMNSGSTVPPVDAQTAAQYNNTTVSPAASAQVQQTEAKAQVTQAENPGVDVLDAATTLFTQQGMKLKTAQEKAGIVQKLIAGEEVSVRDINKMNPTSKESQAIFTQLTGVQFPEGKVTQEQLYNLYRSANATAVEAREQQRAQQAAQEAAFQQAAMERARSVQEQQTPTAQQYLAQHTGENDAQAVSRLAQMRGEIAPDGNALLSFKEFSDFIKQQNPKTTREATARLYDQYLKDNQTVEYRGQRLSHMQFMDMVRNAPRGSELTEAEAEDLWQREVKRQQDLNYNKEDSNGRGEDLVHSAGLSGVSDQSAGGQGSGVSEAAGRAEGDGGTRRGNQTGSRAGQSRESVSEEVSRKTGGGFRELRIGDQAVTEVLPEVYTPEMQTAVERFNGTSANVHVVLEGYPIPGTSSFADGITIRQKDGRIDVYLQATSRLSLEGRANHELSHVAMFDNPEVKYQAIRALKESTSEQELEDLVVAYQTMYGNAYADSDDLIGDLLEEIVCDAYAGLNRANAGAPKYRSAVSAALDPQMHTYTAAYRESLALTDDSGNLVVESDDKGHSRFSLRTFKDSGREILDKWMRRAVVKGDLTQQDAGDILSTIDTIYDVCEKYKDEYGPFSVWSDAKVVTDEKGNPVFSVVKANGDYSMNLDFSLVCKKRRTLDAVLNELVQRGFADNLALGQEDIVKINDVIREHGFETACALCFVDAKRFRQGKVADDFVKLYNDMVLSLIPENSGFEAQYFNFGGDSTITAVSNPIDQMPNSQLDFTHINEVLKTYGSKTVEHKVAKLLKNSAQDRKLTKRGDFLSTRGFDAINRQNPRVLKLFNAKKGSGGPKSAVSDVQYLNEVLKPNSFKQEKAYAVGGVRIQSFSDYVPRMVFDYVQMIADLSAKKLPAHAYTKEELFVKQFGLTGMKINMSLIPKVVDDGIAAGLDADGNYAWADESFDYDEALKIQSAEGYSRNCGTIAVGVSDEHIRALMADPDIRMVIPYHKSGLNPIVAKMNKIEAFTDYTDYQNTRHKDGTKLNPDNAADKRLLKEAPNFNQRLHELGENGDPRQVVEEYVKWCEDNDLLPKFDQFLYQQVDGVFVEQDGHKVIDPNYYKLIEDFTVYDGGSYVAQGPLSMSFPTEDSAFGSMAELIKRGLEEDAVLEGKRDSEVGAIVDEIIRGSRTTDAAMQDDSGMAFYDTEKKYSVLVEDKDTLDFLNNQKTIKTYKTMQLVDGKLYPPMASRINGKFEDASELGKWEQATEHPELIKNGNKFKLDKGKGNGSIEAAYNPYMHSSNLVINDQFTGAYTRDNLVTVECEVPVSEVTSGYHAEYAKDSVGWHSWHTGTVAGQIRKEKGIERQVFLSRWIKPVRIVPDSEVASMYKTLLDGTDIAVPDNVVTPSLRDELKKAGVKLQESGKVRYSIIADTDLSFAEQVDLVSRNRLNEVLEPGTSYQYGLTDSALYVQKEPNPMMQELGYGDYALVVTQDHIRQMLGKREDSSGNVINEHNHQLTVDQVSRIPELLRSPAAVLVAKGRPESLVFVTTEADYRDRPIIIPVKANGTNLAYDGVEGPAHVVTSMYGRDDFGKFFSDAVNRGELVYYKKERIDPILTNAGYQSSGLLSGIDSDTIVGQVNPIVKNPGERKYSLTEENDAMENEKAIRKLENEIEDINAKLDLASVDGLSEIEIRRLRNQLAKSQYELDQRNAAERKAAVRTPLQTVLDNLDNYRTIDLESIANQLTDNAWDDVETLSTEELKSGIREILQERAGGMSPLEMQSPKFGVYVRKPSTSAGVRYSITPEFEQWYLEGFTDQDDRDRVKQEIEDLRTKYGTIPAGENPVREVNLPRKIDEKTRVHDTARTVMEAEATPEKRLADIQKALLDGKLADVPVKNDVVSRRARARVEKNGWQTSLTDWTAKVRAGETSADLVAEGAVLLNNAGNSDMSGEQYVELLTDYSNLMHRTGQSLQAARILKTLSPEGRLYGIQKTVDQLNDNNRTKAEKKKGFDPAAWAEQNEIKLDPALVDAYRNAKTDTERDFLLGQIQQNIADQMPASLSEKLNNWRYLAMLGNFRTQIRNVLGNFFFQIPREVKETVAGGIEGALEKAGVKIDRTRSVVRDNATYKAAMKDFDSVRDIILSGGKVNEKMSYLNGIDSKRRIYKNKVLEGYRRVVNTAMDSGDAVFCKFTYADSLARFMAANHTTWDAAPETLREKGRLLAIKEAAEATYRDNNAFSEMVLSMRFKNPGSNKAKKAVNAVVEGILPFRKTPANILVRGVEYSPLGLVKTAVDTVSAAKGSRNVTGSDLVNEFAKSLTGSGLFALGYFLTKMGVLTALGPDDDDKEKEFWELQGNQSYSINLFGRSYTIDWLAPEAIPLLVGANTAEIAAEEGLDLNAVTKAATRITDPMLEMSMLQGVNSLIENISNTKTVAALPSLVLNSLWSYGLQYVPTLTGQLNRAMDNTRRTTYTDATSGVPTGVQYSLGKLSQKVPGWSYNQIPYIDQWGRMEENYESKLGNAFAQFLSPAYQSIPETSDMERELQRLYDATGETGVLPSKAPKYLTVDGARRDLTAEEYVNYATLRGQTSYDMLTDLTGSSVYRKMPDKDKEKAVGEIYSYAADLAKQDLLGGETKGTTQKAVNADSYGISSAEYAALKTQTAGIESLKYKNQTDADGKPKTIQNSQGLQIMESVYSAYPNLTKKQYEALFEALGVGKTVRGYSKQMVQNKLKQMRRQAAK